MVIGTTLSIPVLHRVWLYQVCLVLSMLRNIYVPLHVGRRWCYVGAGGTTTGLAISQCATCNAPGTDGRLPIGYGPSQQAVVSSNKASNFGYINTFYIDQVWDHTSLTWQILNPTDGSIILRAPSTSQVQTAEEEMELAYSNGDFDMINDIM